MDSKQYALYFGTAIVIFYVIVVLLNYEAFTPYLNREALTTEVIVFFFIASVAIYYAVVETGETRPEIERPQPEFNFDPLGDDAPDDDADNPNPPSTSHLSF